MLEQLVAFKEKHGHCNVPAVYDENRQLGSWVHGQRTSKDRLSADKIAKLDSIGFNWGGKIYSRFLWNQMFEQLVAFKEKHGHCNVPAVDRENRQLGRWVHGQRTNKYSLSPEKIAELDSNGFDWAPLATAWNQMFGELVAFKKKNGHCNVPQQWEENRQLGLWVGTQRRVKDRLSTERIAKLNSIGFEWSRMKK
jgi:hypothetical protein